MVKNVENDRSVSKLLSTPFSVGGGKVNMEVENDLMGNRCTDRSIGSLSKDEKINIRQMDKLIQVGDNESIISYGSNVQSGLYRFSENILDHVKSTEVSVIGNVLIELMSKLNEIDINDLNGEKKKGIMKIFTKSVRPVKEMMMKYEYIGTQVDRIGMQLNKSKKRLIDDVRMLDSLYEQNKTYFHELNDYIVAAELKVENINTMILPELQMRAKGEKDQMKVQEVHDMQKFVTSLENRIYDLKLSQNITLQSATQIRMIQQTNQILAEKIQSSTMTAIPLWRNQIAIALSLYNQKNAVESQKLATKITNELILWNSKIMKNSGIETANGDRKGLTEMDTLRKTQGNLIQTIEETMVIQLDVGVKSKQAEKAIEKMNQDLKNRLLMV